MTFYVENEHEYAFGFSLEEVLSKVADGVFSYLGTKNETLSSFEISLYVVDEEEIHEMNLENRGIDRATDVLSFPNLSFEEVGVFSEEECEMSVNPENGEVVLGDIVLCYQRICSQAEEYGHSVLRETAFLICHSLLHLSGYDHETPEEAAEMESLQNRILNSLGITRD